MGIRFAFLVGDRYVEQMAEFSTTNSSAILADIKKLHYPYYLWVMLAPNAVRIELLALLALDVELANIPNKVSEEMLGHIRYTWWRESFESLQQGKVREQPILQLWSLLHTKFDLAHWLISKHSEHFEQHPDAGLAHALGVSRQFVYEQATDIIGAAALGQLAKWQRKVAVVDAYHQTGKLSPASPWLMLRLLFC